MAITRVKKEAQIDSLKGDLSAAVSVVVVQYKGLTVAQLTALRKQIRAEGGKFRVTKNRLAKRALTGTEFEPISQWLSGPTGIGIAKDPISAAKVIVKFAKDNENLVILGGAVDKQAIDVAGVEALATMPSLDELRAKLIALISTPATRIATVLQAPAAQLARVTNAKATKGE